MDSKIAKERLNALKLHQQTIKNQISSPTPKKHAHREHSYKQFLQRELDAVNQSIENLKLDGTNG